MTGWVIWEVLGLRDFGLSGFMWLIRVFLVEVQGAKWEGLVGCKIFAKACVLGSIGMIMWVVVLHWLRVCDYSC